MTCTELRNMSKRTWSKYYTLEATPIGRGGQADVFKAVDRKTGKTVALKRLRDPMAEEGRARMQHEVEVQENLNHSRVMPVLRHSERYSWYSMPLARRTLSQLIPPLPDQQILEIVSAGVEALIAAHQRRYVHRDITPYNILDLGSDQPHWVISDWGLVRRHGITSLTRTKPGEFGTAGYAAPETWLNAHEADERADIYSLGRVVAWASTGSSLIPNVPFIPDGLFEHFVRVTTALRPEDRPATASAALELLGTIAAPASTNPARSAEHLSEIVASIRSKAAEQFPDDYSTQKYVIQREIDAWHQLHSLAIEDLPAEVIAIITSQAADQFPDDFSTRIYVIEREAAAWRELQTLSLPVPPAVFDGIVAKSRREFPRDYSTQLYVIQREAEAWRELNV